MLRKMKRSKYLFLKLIVFFGVWILIYILVIENFFIKKQYLINYTNIIFTNKSSYEYDIYKLNSEKNVIVHYDIDNNSLHSTTTESKSNIYDYQLSSSQYSSMYSNKSSAQNKQILSVYRGTNQSFEHVNSIMNNNLTQSLKKNSNTRYLSINENNSSSQYENAEDVPTGKNYTFKYGKPFGNPNLTIDFDKYSNSKHSSINRNNSSSYYKNAVGVLNGTNHYFQYRKSHNNNSLTFGLKEHSNATNLSLNHSYDDIHIKNKTTQNSSNSQHSITRNMNLLHVKNESQSMNNDHQHIASQLENSRKRHYVYRKPFKSKYQKRSNFLRPKIDYSSILRDKPPIIHRNKTLSSKKYKYLGNNIIPQIIRNDMQENFKNKSEKINKCPLVPSGLVGYIKVETNLSNIDINLLKNTNISLGGHWKPSYCTSYQKIAVLVPYRDRQEHLEVFIQHIHRFLQKQMIEYRIYIIEQKTGSKFNRGMLFNIGFKLASEIDDYDCYVLHDIDLIPEDDRNMYICSSKPRHMSVAVDVMAYKLPYENLFGGVVAMRKQDILEINGFPNVFFGWGGEDDDVYNRLNRSNMSITRYPPEISRYIMLSHKKEDPESIRFDLLENWRLRTRDGLTTLEFDLIEKEALPLYTRIFVQLNETKIQEQFADLYNMITKHQKVSQDNYDAIRPRIRNLFKDKGQMSPGGKHNLKRRDHKIPNIEENIIHQLSQNHQNKLHFYKYPRRKAAGSPGEIV